MLRAIDQLGYNPSTIARSLKTKKSTTIGVVVSDILNPVFSALAKGIEDVMLERNYNLILCNSDENPERELRYLRMLVGKQVDGIVITPTGKNLNFLLHTVAANNCPIVLIDRKIEGLPTDCVTFDNEMGAYQATRHLIELGHRRIALLNLPSTLTPGHERLFGYERALREADLPRDPNLVVEGSFKADEAYRLAEIILNSPEPPTALLVSSNRLLAGVLNYTKQHCIPIPQKLALVGFDDVPYYAYTSPSITAVSTDLKHMGTVIGRLLEQHITNFDKDYIPQNIRVPSKLIVRESTIGSPAGS
ncbi:MAG: LacI family DNA-binding transcriptional regulator [Chloroflexi bacterium]|nr:LacI family DNA-binding transcriptional regulator [Chloroflexota bacterium]